MRRDAGNNRGAGAMRCAVAALAVGVAAACVPQTPTPTEPTTVEGDELVRLNEVQLIGSHNSYHIAPEGTVLLPLILGGVVVPDLVAALGNPMSLNYTHEPLPTQLRRGIRTFELDIYADPDGGRYRRPHLVDLLGLQQPRLPRHMDEPGFKVIHISDIDYLSTCETLLRCLGEIRKWSDDHPDHLPIVINLEMKGSQLPVPESLGFTDVLPFDGDLLDAVDDELRAALGDRLITPDVVRGDAADLRTAITTGGWPTVAESRGKVLVFMDNADLRTTYLAGHPSLEGRAMFTSSGEGRPDGAILKVNDPGDGTRIRSLVEQGYIVRTRADDDVAVEPPVAQRDTALASGAQIVHSDYPPGEVRPISGYTVTFGTRVAARCNPVVTTSATCAPAAVIEP